MNLDKAERVMVRVDRPLSDDELVVAGHYTGRIDRGLFTPDNFDFGEPFVGEREMLVLRAEHFPQRGHISGRDGLRIANDLGFRSPTFREILAFGAQSLPEKWQVDDHGGSYIGSTSKWYMVIGLNLHHRVRDESSRSNPAHMYDGAPAIYSHDRGRGLVYWGLYNLMIGAWPRNPWYLMVPKN